MHCASCSALIESSLKKTAGVIEANVSFKPQEATVKFDEQEVQEEEIVQIIKNVGDYQVI